MLNKLLMMLSSGKNILGTFSVVVGNIQLRLKELLSSTLEYILFRMCTER